MTALLPLLFTLVLAGSGPGEAPEHAFATIDGHYQSIRLALLEDSTKGVQGHARAIVTESKALKAAPSAAKAGVGEADVTLVSELLGEVVERAETLAAATEIGAQREALKALTRPLVRWHEKVRGAKPRLAYCSMERGAWFQQDGVLGNPYGGTRMPRCGVFVQE